jgi:hypothetical protein
MIRKEGGSPMSPETKKVLEMLASGQITADDAEKLLEKLGASGPGPTKSVASEDVAGTARKLRFLRVVVDSPDRDQVNVRVPLAMLGTGIKLLAVLPPKVSERLAEKGIDVSALRDLPREELLEQLRDLHVDVDSKSGEKVRIFCE